MLPSLRALVALSVSVILGFLSFSSYAADVPPDLQGLEIEQKLNNQVPTDLSFVDEAGKTVKLSDYLTKRPAILVLAYYDCPHLCTRVLNGVGEAVSKMNLKIGTDYQIITVSIDPDEDSELATQKKKAYVDGYLHGDGTGWHFLTGAQPEITRLAKAVGFHYRYDSKSEEFLHAAGIMVLTPQGKVSHYFLGIQYAPRDLRLSLIEAADGKIRSPVDRLVLFCCGVDLTTGKYTASIWRIVQLICGVLVAGLGGTIFVLSRSKSSK